MISQSLALNNDERSKTPTLHAGVWISVDFSGGQDLLSLTPHVDADGRGRIMTKRCWVTVALDGCYMIALVKIRAKISISGRVRVARVGEE